jgi:hypothetical protein
MCRAGREMSIELVRELKRERVRFACFEAMLLASRPPDQIQGTTVCEANAAFFVPSVLHAFLSRAGVYELAQ